MRFKCMTLFLLSICLLGFAGIGGAKSPGANGVPFQNLQQQIDELRLQIETLKRSLYASAKPECTLALADGRVYPADCPRIAFVTGAGYDGNLMQPLSTGAGVYRSGVAGADARCQLHANSAYLPGVYKAWIAHGDYGDYSAYSPAEDWGPPPANDPGYMRVDGKIIATSWDDLTDDNGILVPIMLNEFGNVPWENTAGQSLAWTNVGLGGLPLSDAPGYSCNAWTSSDHEWPNFGNVGDAKEADKVVMAGDYLHIIWTDAFFFPLNSELCSSQNRLYCFQQHEGAE